MAKVICAAFAGQCTLKSGGVKIKTNKTMNLYTEEQVYDAISKAFRYKSNIEILNSLTPIELPTDEEIEKAGAELFDKVVYIDYEWFIGAKWMRDKIQGGNK